MTSLIGDDAIQARIQIVLFSIAKEKKKKRMR